MAIFNNVINNNCNKQMSNILVGCHFSVEHNLETLIDNNNII